MNTFVCAVFPYLAETPFIPHNTFWYCARFCWTTFLEVAVFLTYTVHTLHLINFQHIPIQPTSH